MTIHFRSIQFVAFLAVALMLSGCAETQLVSHWAKKVSWPGQAESKGTYKVGKPYKVGSVWYYPQENFSLVETGIASWYGPGFHAKNTSNGEVFDQSELTAAHRTLQLPSLVRVTNLENGRSVIVRVNDRGPFKHGRIMDLSQRAAELLGFANKGTARIRLEVLERESRAIADAARRGEDTTRLTMDDIRERAGAPVPQARLAANAPIAATPMPEPALEGDETMPESMRTPTITVEALKGGHSATLAPVESSAVAAPPSGHMKEGRFMPDPVVTKSSVVPTGIFVQAGSFGVKGNADRLAASLKKIAPTIVDPVTVGGRQMYRVKLGPFSSVSKADSALEKVIRTGQGSAKVVKNR